MESVKWKMKNEIFIKRQMMNNLLLTYIGVGIFLLLGLIFAIFVKPEK